MRRSQAAVAVKHEHAEVKAEAVGLAVKADFPPDEAEAMPDALTGLAATPCAAEPKGSEAIVPTPFPGFARPQPQECTAARDALAALHGAPDIAGITQRSVLDSLVRTILSQNTTDATSQRAFVALKQTFPTWQAVREAQPGAVEAAIRVGGLADIKAARIRAILDTLVQERGACCLEHLRALPDGEVKLQLTRFKGVGPKTVACIMMFGLQRYEFPVDTHVWRIAKALGWVPAKATREQAYLHLNARVPDAIKYDLHVLLVEHGKRCPRCAKIPGRNRKEPVGECPLKRVQMVPCDKEPSAVASTAEPGGKRKRKMTL